MGKRPAFDVRAGSLSALCHKLWQALHVVTLASLFFAMFACGYNDTGEGTRTLNVQANVQYDWQIDTTHAEFYISHPEHVVEDANVILIRADTQTKYTAQATRVPGKYTVDIPGYAQRLDLAIATEQDALSCKLEGPGAHVVVSPAPGTTLAANDDLAVRWSTDDGIQADVVTLSLPDSNWQQQLDKDTGRAIIPSKVLTAGAHVVKIRRSNRLVPSGSVDSQSAIDVTYSVLAPFQVRAEKTP